jgi:hypothetical protein
LGLRARETKVIAEIAGRRQLRGNNRAVDGEAKGRFETPKPGFAPLTFRVI